MQDLGINAKTSHMILYGTILEERYYFAAPNTDRFWQLQARIDYCDESADCEEEEIQATTDLPLAESRYQHDIEQHQHNIELQDQQHKFRASGSLSTHYAMHF